MYFQQKTPRTTTKKQPGGRGTPWCHQETAFGSHHGGPWKPSLHLGRGRGYKWVSLVSFAYQHLLAQSRNLQRGCENMKRRCFQGCKQPWVTPVLIRQANDPPLTATNLPVVDLKPNNGCVFPLGTSKEKRLAGDNHDWRFPLVCFWDKLQVTGKFGNLALGICPWEKNGQIDS